MQPENDGNLQKQEQKPEEPVEMYAPEATDDDSDTVQNPNENPKAQPSKNDVKFEPIHWAASEYVELKKNGLWFVAFAIVILALIAADLFFIKSYTFSALVIVMAAAIVIYSRRPPRMVEYTLSVDQGLYIGEKLYHFSEFKAFGLIQDQGQHSIMLIPVKRFAIGVSVYFPEDVGEKIVDILGARLPMRPLKLDLIDVIVRKLRL